MNSVRKCDLVRETEGGLWRLTFTALGSPCEFLLDSAATSLAPSVWQILLDAVAEVRRIEAKFSRYQPTSVLSCLNSAAGTPCTVDAETARLLDFADQCYALSDGRFDVTSGVLRSVWKFGSDGATIMPEPAQVDAMRQLVGWSRVAWKAPELTLPEGMALDFGGIGKEYAVDRVTERLATQMQDAFLVNLGGDLRTCGARQAGRSWVLGIENPASVTQAAEVIALHQGALATSGDVRRHFVHAGRRYGHILDPTTGYPVVGAPRSITVAAPTCTEAGIMATLAMLEGPEAEDFLRAQGLHYWVLWDGRPRQAGQRINART